MTEILTRDADKGQRALAKGSDEARLTVSRETAEWIARLVDAKANGPRRRAHEQPWRGQPDPGRSVAGHVPAPVNATPSSRARAT